MFPMGLLPLLEVTWEAGNDRKQEGDWSPILVTQGAGRGHFQRSQASLPTCKFKAKMMNFKMLSLSAGISCMSALG